MSIQQSRHPKSAGDGRPAAPEFLCSGSAHHFYDPAPIPIDLRVTSSKNLLGGPGR